MSRQQTKSVAIIGAGLAGAASANAFANKGYSVVVYEQSTTFASGASGVPIAMFAPSISSDDAPHSRLLRRGVHLLLRELRRLTAAGLMIKGVDWALTGVLERCIRGDKKLPSTWLAPQDPIHLQSQVSGEPCKMWPVEQEAKPVQEIWHGAAGWVHPKRLIAAWLSHPHIKVETTHKVADYSTLDADVLVVAAGYQTAELLPQLKTDLQMIRGQVEWGTDEVRAELAHALPAFPVNGMGHFIQSPSSWLAGATFQRDECDLQPRAKDGDLNFEKLTSLMPSLTKAHQIRLREASHSWVGVRVAQKNRQPLMQKMYNVSHPNVWVCTGLGSRGLSLAALCAEALYQAALAGGLGRGFSGGGSSGEHGFSLD